MGSSFPAGSLSDGTGRAVEEAGGKRRRSIMKLKRFTEHFIRMLPSTGSVLPLTIGNNKAKKVRDCFGGYDDERAKKKEYAGDPLPVEAGKPGIPRALETRLPV